MVQDGSGFGGEPVYGITKRAMETMPFLASSTRSRAITGDIATVNSGSVMRP